jgi:Dynamin family
MDHKHSTVANGAATDRHTTTGTFLFNVPPQTTAADSKPGPGAAAAAVRVTSSRDVELRRSVHGDGRLSGAALNAYSADTKANSNYLQGISTIGLDRRSWELLSPLMLSHKANLTGTDTETEEAECASVSSLVAVLTRWNKTMTVRLDAALNTGAAPIVANSAEQQCLREAQSRTQALLQHWEESPDSYPSIKILSPCIRSLLFVLQLVIKADMSRNPAHGDDAYTARTTVIQQSRQRSTAQATSTTFDGPVGTMESQADGSSEVAGNAVELAPLCAPLEAALQRVELLLQLIPQHDHADTLKWEHRGRFMVYVLLSAVHMHEQHHMTLNVDVALPRLALAVYALSQDTVLRWSEEEHAMKIPANASLSSYHQWLRKVDTFHQRQLSVQTELDQALSRLTSSASVSEYKDHIDSPHSAPSRSVSNIDSTLSPSPSSVSTTTPKHAKDGVQELPDEVEARCKLIQLSSTWMDHNYDMLDRVQYRSRSVPPTLCPSSSDRIGGIFDRLLPSLLMLEQLVHSSDALGSSSVSTRMDLRVRQNITEIIARRVSGSFSGARYRTSITGYVNSGKSTVLNVLLGTELSPSSESNMTTLPTIFVHDPSKKPNSDGSKYMEPMHTLSLDATFWNSCISVFFEWIDDFRNAEPGSTSPETVDQPNSSVDFLNAAKCNWERIESEGDQQQPQQDQPPAQYVAPSIAAGNDSAAADVSDDSKRQEQRNSKAESVSLTSRHWNALYCLYQRFRSRGPSSFFSAEQEATAAELAQTMWDLQLLARCLIASCCPKGVTPNPAGDKVLTGHEALYCSEEYWPRVFTWCRLCSNLSPDAPVRFELVDCPGLGEPTAIVDLTKACIERSNVALTVLTKSSVNSEALREILQASKRSGILLFAILNKIDDVPPHGRERCLQRVTQVVTGDTGDKATVVSLSALTAKRGQRIKWLCNTGAYQANIRSIWQDLPESIDSTIQAQLLSAIDILVATTNPCVPLCESDRLLLRNQTETLVKPVVSAWNDFKRQEQKSSRGTTPGPTVDDSDSDVSSSDDEDGANVTNESNGIDVVPTVLSECVSTGRMLGLASNLLISSNFKKVSSQLEQHWLQTLAWGVITGVADPALATLRRILEACCGKVEQLHRALAEDDAVDSDVDSKQNSIEWDDFSERWRKKCDAFEIDLKRKFRAIRDDLYQELPDIVNCDIPKQQFEHCTVINSESPEYSELPLKTSVTDKKKDVLQIPKSSQAALLDEVQLILRRLARERLDAAVAKLDVEAGALRRLHFETLKEEAKAKSKRLTRVFLDTENSKGAPVDFDIARFTNTLIAVRLERRWLTLRLWRHEVPIEDAGHVYMTVNRLQKDIRRAEFEEHCYESYRVHLQNHVRNLVESHRITAERLKSIGEHDSLYAKYTATVSRSEQVQQVVALNRILAACTNAIHELHNAFEAVIQATGADEA